MKLGLALLSYLLVVRVETKTRLGLNCLLQELGILEVLGFRNQFNFQSLRLEAQAVQLSVGRMMR